MGWGGVGWGMLTFVWTWWGSWCYADDGVGWGMLTFVWTWWGSWCYADDGVGWGGVGHANVRVNLLRFLMLRWWWGGVGWGGGMLTFVWTWWGSWCYADDGVGWGGVGHANVRVNLLRFLMLRWWWGGVGWGGVGHVNVRVNLLRMGWGRVGCQKKPRKNQSAYRHNRCRMDVLQEIRAKEFACPECGLDSLLQNVAMEIHPHVQKLGESHGVQTARDVKKKRCRQLRKPELVWSKNCVSPRRNTHLSKKPPNSDVWISEFLWSLNCVFAKAKRWFFWK